MTLAFSVESSQDDSPLGGAFYLCVDVEKCGMRFPVTEGDPFRGHCPRCRAPVQFVANVQPNEPTPINELPSIPKATVATSNISLLLDNWRSLFNVGAAFRTADGAGVRHLYLCGITANPDQQRKLAKTALGAEREVMWSYHPDAVTLATKLKDEGTELWVLERNTRAGSLFDITSVSNKTSVVLAAGNEVVGVDPGLVALADQVIQLPMQGSKQSLNVAVALSIATYWLQAMRQDKRAENERA